MRLIKKAIDMVFILLIPLALYGCSSGSAEEPSSTSEITVSASFQQEDGNALSDSTVRLAFGENALEYPLDENGEVKLSGLPRSGDWMLTILDRQEQIQGGMTILLSEGVVIDAATGEGGMGYITLRGDTEEVALFFVLRDDGSILCSLHLTEADVRHPNIVPEDEHDGT